MIQGHKKGDYWITGLIQGHKKGDYFITGGGFLDYCGIRMENIRTGIMLLDCWLYPGMWSVTQRVIR